MTNNDVRVRSPTVREGYQALADARASDTRLSKRERVQALNSRSHPLGLAQTLSTTSSLETPPSPETPVPWPPALRLMPLPALRFRPVLPHQAKRDASPACSDWSACRRPDYSRFWPPILVLRAKPCSRSSCAPRFT